MQNKLEFIFNSQHPSPYSPNHAETPINKGIGKIRHSPRYSPCTSPTCSPTRSFTSVKQRISEFLKFDDGEPSSEYPGEVLGEYLSTKIAHKPLTDKYLSFHWWVWWVLFEKRSKKLLGNTPRVLKNTPWVLRKTHGVFSNSHGVFPKTRDSMGAMGVPGYSAYIASICAL